MKKIFGNKRNLYIFILSLLSIVYGFALYQVYRIINSPILVTILTILYGYLVMLVACLLSKQHKSIQFAKARLCAKIPSRTQGNAGFDIYGILPKDEKECIVINPHETKLIPTGIKSIIPNGYYVQIQERGSTGSKGIKYSAGVIDSSYRGEWFLATTNTNDKPVVFYDDIKNNMSGTNNNIKSRYDGCILYPLSKAIFQGIIHNSHDEIDIEEVSLSVVENDITERGEGRLGSSGK